MVQRSAYRSRAAFSRSAASAAPSSSQKAASAAPRESASKPSAPLPAKGSSTCAPETSARIAKSDSRTRSDVGLVPRPGGAAIRAPFRSPATIRIRAAYGVRMDARRPGCGDSGLGQPVHVVAEGATGGGGDDRARRRLEVGVGGELVGRLLAGRRRQRPVAGKAGVAQIRDPAL